ncbi:MAG: SDR family NAD(P)-dependent oxidoreductase [Parvibaculum sp.]
MDHQNDLAVIIGVGASNGIGGALARKFAAKGSPVLLAGRTEAKLKNVADEVIATGGKAELIVSDVTKSEDVKAIFSKARELGPVGAVLYNAGNNAIIPFNDLTAEQFEQFWRVCCFGAFLTAKEAMPLLTKQSHGSFIVTGASASMRGKARFAHFASAKGALRNLVQSLAREYGPAGIHCAHVIIDGVVNGDIVRERFGEFLDQLGKDGTLDPNAIAETFWQIHAQPKAAWTQEVDLRPYKENW